MENRATPELVGAEHPIDMMDLALTIAENIWLLLMAPVVVGVVAYGVASFLPRSFESIAVVQPTPPVSIPTGKDTVMLNPSALTYAFANVVATKMATPSFLEGAQQALKRQHATASSTATQNQYPLNASVTTQVGSSDNLVTLRVSSSSPSASQFLAIAILERTYSESRPKQSMLKRLIAERALLEQQIAGLELTEQKIQALIERSGATSDLSGLANTHALISSSLVEMHRRSNEIDAQLEGITDDDVVQKPTLPSGPSSPRRMIIALLSAIGTMFALLIVIFVRQSWRASGTSPQHEQRLDALKRRYGHGR